MQRFLAEARSWFARSRGGFVAARGAAIVHSRVGTDTARRRLLAGSGEVRALLRGPALRDKPIGMPAAWPRALLGAMEICIESPVPTWLIWDPDDALLLYNDAALLLLGSAHPRAFGDSIAESGIEICETSAPCVESVFASGRPRRLADQLLMLPRNGRTEERYFDLLVTAVLDGGDVHGVLCMATETTASVRAARRSAALADLASRAAGASGEQDAWLACVAALERVPADLPYVMLYAADGPDDVARLTGAVGLEADSARAPARIDPSAADTSWPLGEVGRTLEPAMTSDALICPLASANGGLCGYLIAGLSPRLPLDDAYRGFVIAAADRIAAGIAVARARDEHARREASLERGRLRLEQRCAELTRLYELAPIPMLVVRGRNYVVERINAAAQAESNGKDLLGVPLFDALPELAGQGFDRRLASVLDTGQPDIGQEVVVRLDRGGRLEDAYFTFISAPLQRERKDEPRIIIVAINLTEQVRARGALEASEARYRHIFNTIDVSIWEEDFSRVLPALEEISASGVDDLRRYLERHPDFLHRALEQVSVVDVNESTLRLFEASDKRELVRSVRKLFLAETWQAFAEKLIAMSADRRLVRTDTAAATLHGERRELMMTIAPSGDTAQPERALITLTDITERKRMEQALREADRQKDEFLATLAHELRNPLAPLRSGVDLLRTVKQTPQEVLDIVERQVEHLARLANDLFESSRIRRGSYDLRKKRVAVVEVLRDAAEASGALMRASGHELEMHMPEEPLWIDGDRTRLAQIFANLLNNAARYTTQPGRITVIARRVGKDAEVEISDTGVGISADAMASLFTMFARLGGDSDASAAGLGIGLALAKQLTEMHGGTIEARSEGAGKGSTFTVRLPLADVDQPLPTAEEDAAGLSIAGRRLLVVEDDRDTAESLKLILEANGATVRVASNGPKALASFASFEPDVVLLDIGLPGMNGYEVARRLRAEFASRPTLIVALTGWGREEDVKLALDAGFDDHLVKPVEIGALRRLLARPADRVSR